jgi:hypothetical protein
MRHELVSLFGGRIERQRMIDVLMHSEGHFGICAIHRARRCIHEMLDAVVPTTLENVRKAHHIAVDVCERILERIAHAGLRSQMHDALELPRREQVRHARTRGQIQLYELKVRITLEHLESRFLERHFVVIVEIVETDHLIAAF